MNESSMARSATTVGDWLLLYDRFRDGAWILLHEVALGVLEGWRIPEVEKEDIRQEILIRVISHGAHAIRRTGPRVTLAAFVRGVARNLYREKLRQKRRGPLLLGAADQFLETEPPKTTSNQTADHRPEDPSADSRLTRREKEALDAWLEEPTIQSVACRLGVSRTSARERLSRGVRRQREGAPPVIPRWDGVIEPEHLRELDPINADVLRRFQRGDSIRLIGRALGMSRAAIRCRLQRIRRMHRSRTRVAGEPPRAPPDAQVTTL